MADVIIGTHAEPVRRRRKVFAARPAIGKIGTESRHLWLPPNVAREILHVIPSGRYRNCLRVAQLQFPALIAVLTDGSQVHNGPSLRDSAVSA